MAPLSKKQITMNIVGAIIVVCVIVAMFLGSHVIETVEKGTYHIKQAAITGEMTAHMKPGTYGQWFGDITVWPVSDTFYFTADKDTTDDIAEDRSIEVRFNDGSVANISGTCRVKLPSSESEVIDLLVKLGYRSYDDMEAKLILPVVRKALRNTANFMSARESYREKRADFRSMAWDQVLNGPYQTETIVKEVTDLITGDKVNREIKVIKKDADGNPAREANPMEATGVTLSNFEIKKFVYQDKVKAQIDTQQEAMMAVATAKSKAEQAKQEAIQLEAQGKANVMKAKYEEEQKKIKQVVQQEAAKEVAVIEAQKKLEVATLDKQSAEQEKQADILRGEGQAKARELVLAADGALTQKLDAYVEAQKVWADAFSKRPVPSVVLGNAGKGGTDTDAMNLSSLVDVMLLDKLGLDMKIEATQSQKKK